MTKPKQKSPVPRSRPSGLPVKVSFFGGVTVDTKAARFTPEETARAVAELRKAMSQSR